MDKSRKLRRYLKKDYSQLVDFPVEIVGRDGVVRRYTFEASVRLYQRRIVSAPNRYDDGEVVAAEVRHCRRRIEQLRHSYYKRFGWSSLEEDSGLADLCGEYAGEVAAFLRRFYGDGQEAETLHLEWLGSGVDQDPLRAATGSSAAAGPVGTQSAGARPSAEPEGPQVFFVCREETGERYLLYLCRFESHGACQGREDFFELLRSVQAVAGEGVERLLAFHHTADCGLILTGTGASDGPLDDATGPVDLADPAFGATPAPAGAEADSADEIDQYLLGTRREDPLREGLGHLGRGEPQEALGHFERAIHQNPWIRQPYVAAAVVADALGQVPNAEMIARMGLSHFPNDPVLQYHLGLSRFRQGDFPGAREAMDASLGQRPDLFPARFIRASLLLAGGDYREARGAFAEAASRARPEDARALEFVRRVERWLEIRRIGAITSAVLFAAGAVVLLGAVALGLGALPASAGPLEGLRPVAVGVGLLIAGPTLAGAGALAFRAGLSRLLSGPRARAFRLFPPENPGGTSGTSGPLTV